MPNKHELCDNPYIGTGSACKENKCTTCNWFESVYDRMVMAGVEIDNHESDLYVPVNATTTKLLSFLPQTLKITTTFRNNIDGEMWYEIPFAFSKKNT